MKNRITDKISALVLAFLALILFGATTTTALPTLHANGKIVFTSDRDGNLEIYVMNNDGTGQTRLTNNTAIDYDYLPTFSPDGRKIAFVSQHGSSAASIKIMNADGTNQTELTPLTPSMYQYNWNEFRSLSWSPDGSKIAFDDADDIYTVNVDRSNRTNLTNHPARDVAPTWSPDGTRILFVRGGYFLTMYTMNSDGSDVRALPISYFSDYGSPDWSPTNNKITFVLTFKDAFPILFTADADGTNRQVFDGNGTGNGETRNKPKWSPDAKKIVFHIYKFPSMDCEIYVKNADGSGLAQLTDTTGSNFQPSWQPLLPARTFADFDGDGRADISVFRPSDGVWYLNQSTNGFSATQFGLSTDKITPADYDGDGKTDIAVFRDGIWYLLRSTAGFGQIQFGQAGDIPQPADFDGDGRAELAVYRNGTWWTLNLATNQVNTIHFGLPTDKPVVADYDGDGRADRAVYRNGEWHLNRSSQGYAVVNFGLANDKLVPADYDGDGKTDQAVYRDGTWWILQSSQGAKTFRWGIASDTPAPADYDGDGRTDIAIYRDGTWFIVQSSNGNFSYQQFGLSSDIPIAGANQEKSESAGETLALSLFSYKKWRKKMKQLMFSILCLMFPAAFVFAQTPQTIQKGFSVERELGETETHIYEVNLTKGQMLNFVVEQRGIDVVLHVYTADGKLFDRVDSPNEREGDEPFKMISLIGGRYRIKVSRLWEDTVRTTGKYFVKTVEIRPATGTEIKAARLKEELMKIVAEENRFGSYPEVVKRYFTERALVTNAFGFTAGAAELLDFTTKNPPKMPAGASSEDEFSAARLEDFGEVVVLIVNRDRRFKNPKANIDQLLSQRSSYVFKRVKSEWRIINVQRSFSARERQPIKLDVRQLDALVGVYDGGGNASETISITREGSELFGNFPEQEKFRLFPDTANIFVGGFIGIAFVRDTTGAVTQAVVYHSLPDDRMTIQPKIK